VNDDRLGFPCRIRQRDRGAGAGHPRRQRSGVAGHASVGASLRAARWAGRFISLRIVASCPMPMKPAMMLRSKRKPASGRPAEDEHRRHRSGQRNRSRHERVADGDRERSDPGENRPCGPSAFRAEVRSEGRRLFDVGPLRRPLRIDPSSPRGSPPDLRALVQQRRAIVGSLETADPCAPGCIQRLRAGTARRSPSGRRCFAGRPTSSTSRGSRAVVPLRRRLRRKLPSSSTLPPPSRSRPSLSRHPRMLGPPLGWISARPFPGLKLGSPPSLRRAIGVDDLAKLHDALGQRPHRRVG